MHVIRRLEEIFIFQTTYFKFGNLLAGWRLVINAKFQHNISKVSYASQAKKTQGQGCEYQNSSRVTLSLK